MRIWPIIVVLVSGCNTPSVDYWGVPATRIEVGQSTFDVRVSDRKAEAIRINSEYAPNVNYTAKRFQFAFEQVSGCKVRKGSLRGDQAMMTAQLACGSDDPNAPVLEGVLRCDVSSISRYSPDLVADCRVY